MNLYFLNTPGDLLRKQLVVILVWGVHGEELNVWCSELAPQEAEIKYLAVWLSINGWMERQRAFSAEMKMFLKSTAEKNRRTGAKGKSFGFSGPSAFQPSPMIVLEKDIVDTSIWNQRLHYLYEPKTRALEQWNIIKSPVTIQCPMSAVQNRNLSCKSQRKLSCTLQLEMNRVRNVLKPVTLDQPENTEISASY